MGLRREGALVKSTPNKVQAALSLKLGTIARPMTRNCNHRPQKPKGKPLQTAGEKPPASVSSRQQSAPPALNQRFNRTTQTLSKIRIEHHNVRFAR